MTIRITLFGIMTLSIITLSIMTLSITTLSITNLIATLRIHDRAQVFIVIMLSVAFPYCYAECHYA